MRLCMLIGLPTSAAVLSAYRIEEQITLGARLYFCNTEMVTQGLGSGMIGEESKTKGKANISDTSRHEHGTLYVVLEPSIMRE